MLEASSQSISEEGPEKARIYLATHGLAQARLCQDYYSLAEDLCRASIKGWARLFGKRSLYYKRALDLLSFIKDKQGETELASAYAELASNVNAQGVSVIETMKLPESPSIEEIYRLSRQMNQSAGKRDESASRPDFFEHESVGKSHGNTRKHLVRRFVRGGVRLN